MTRYTKGPLTLREAIIYINSSNYNFRVDSESPPPPGWALSSHLTLTPLEKKRKFWHLFDREIPTSMFLEVR